LRYNVFKHVVVALDESECAEQALAVGIALAKAEDSHVCVCSIIDLLPLGGGKPATASSVELVVDADRLAEDRLRDAISKADAMGVRADGDVVMRESASDIVSYAREQGGDVIVIGSRGPFDSSNGPVQEVLNTARVLVIVVSDGVASGYPVTPPPSARGA
jgi:nucleotide-binding universal stress UspA family protein